MSLTSTTALPFHDKDLSLLPPPLAYEALDYESLLDERSATFNALHPLLFRQGSPVFRPAELVETNTEVYWKIPFNSDAGLYYLDLESDPSTRHIQADAYRELLLRQRINEAVLSTMPAYAKGSDLDNIALRYWGLVRLVIVPETEHEPAIMESDEAFLKRMMLSPEGRSKGGSVGWYLFHTLSADSRVKDARIVSPSPYRITITILSHEGDGAASSGLIDEVYKAVTEHYAYPQGDVVTVQSAEIIHYLLNATVQFYPGPASQPILDKIHTEFLAYRKQSERIGHLITQSGIDACLHQSGVYRALVQSPELPVEINNVQAPFCERFDVKEVAL